jgi:type II secretory pathway pseudopilin PulG
MKKLFKRSFTLIEVVLASTVLILFSLAGIIIFSGSMRGVVTSKNYVQAVMLGNSILEDLRKERDDNLFNNNANLPTNPRWSSGPAQTPYCCNSDLSTCSTALCGTSSEMFWTQLQATNQASGLKKFQVEVRWQNYSSSKNIFLYTYFYPWQNF